MGPHSRPAEFILLGSFGGASAEQSYARVVGFCLRVHFPRGESHDRFSGRQKPLGKVAPSSEGVL